MNDTESKLFAKYQLHSDMLHYLAWLEERRVPELKSADFLCMASDGTTCWGNPT